MTLVDESMVHPQGEKFLAELRWIHDVIRNNLASITTVVEAVNNGAAAAHVRARIDELASTSIIWTLRVDCMRYCSFVHGHHHHEDTAFFPTLRHVNPTLRTVIDTLEADHVRVSRYVDAVEAAAVRLDDDEAARVDLGQALTALAEHLLSHMEYEETKLAPTLQRMTHWPAQA